MIASSPAAATAPAAAAAPMGWPIVGGTGPAAVTGQYLVVLKGTPGGSVGQRVARAAADRAVGAGIRVQRSFGSALLGYSARLDAGQLASVRRDPAVAYVEADHVVQTTQTGATWGLDRIDQRAGALNGSYASTATGAGVTAYVVDTGIRSSHVDFAGRAVAGFSSITDGKGTNDCNGHGTHVAGTIGGKTYGVAKAVRLVPVRVLGCTGAGTSSTLIAGLDWIVTNHTTAPAVANLSLSGPPSAAMDAAVGRVIADGVTVTVAAGNSKADACGYSPARTAAAITVGATTKTDSRDTTYSNYGSCVDLFAPGTGITSTWYTSNTALAIASGTSMAAPHAAGVAALLLQGKPAATPAQIRATMVADATAKVLTNIGVGSPNLLLHAPAAGLALAVLPRG